MYQSAIKTYKQPNHPEYDVWTPPACDANKLTFMLPYRHFSTTVQMQPLRQFGGWVLYSYVERSTIGLLSERSCECICSSVQTTNFGCTYNDLAAINADGKKLKQLNVPHFYHAMLRSRARLCHSILSVCLSVRYVIGTVIT